MEINTSEMTGPALDYAVALIERPPKDHGSGVTTKIIIDPPLGSGVYIEEFFNGEHIARTPWRPSTEWAQGGPLIEHHGVVYRHHANGMIEACCMVGTIGIDRKRKGKQLGHDLLTAACRAIVAAKLGPIVNIPDELCAILAQSAQNAES